MDRPEPDAGPSAGSDGPSRDKATVAERFRESGLAEDRFIDVLDGQKGTHDHDTRYTDPRKVPGENYGIYPGGGLVDIDIDDYGEATDEAGLAAVLDLPETFTVESPHTDGEPGGHRYYRVTADRPPESFDRGAILSNVAEGTADAARNDPVALAIAEAFGTPNPHPSWGEVRAINQYVVGPGSQLDGCDKDWCDNCREPDGGWYRVANDAPIATINVGELVEALEADPDLTPDDHTGAGDRAETARLARSGSADGYDPAGTDVEDFIERETAVAQYLAAGAKAAGFEAADGSGDRSRADFYVCCEAIEHGVPESDIRERLEACPNSKVGTSDAARNYWRRTWSKALAEVDEPNKSATDVAEVFLRACDRWQIDSSNVGTEVRDNETRTVGVGSIVDGYDLPEAVLQFDRNADQLSGKDRQAVIGYVVFEDLNRRGEFFQTTDGRLYYFHEPETNVYRVDDPGRRVLTEDFQSFAFDRYNLLAGTFSRNLGKDIKGLALREADEREVYRFAHYDTDAGELYVNDFGNGYYAVSPDAVEWRPNGEDLFFLPTDRADPYEYLPQEDRSELPSEIPGERDMWSGRGDAIMRLFGNRINFAEDAALSPAGQRKQLYIHLHTLPFIDLLNARPIMAWVGEKGSGKTVLQRSIGRFIYGPDFTDSVMPDSKDDFLAKVSNQALAFIDNYDDGIDWAPDILAAVATGAGIDLREYYTTNDLHQEVPRCWLSITSRDPPFNRDDVADRTLVFRVERVEDGFVGMGDYLRQVTAYRDVLWSTYLDNLQAAVAEYAQRDTGAMSSEHRMADWAIFAKIIADALGVADIDELLETMETERATFALENEPWAGVLGRWIEEEPEDAADYHTASDILDALEAVADEYDLPLGVSSAQGIGAKLSYFYDELGELYGLEIDDTGRTNKYRFEGAGDEYRPVGIGRYT